MAENLKIGDKIPLFLVKDHKGYDVTDEDVVGCPLVIYFYPKDDTPGCTFEAEEFQKNINTFDEMQTLVIGVSPDSVKSHKKFHRNHKLEFSLLSDPKKTMFQAFGVIEEDKVVRSTFVLDALGLIKWIEKPVDVKGHVERVINAVKKHCSKDFVKYEDFKGDYAEFLKGSFELTEDEAEMKAKLMKKFGIKTSDLEDKK